MAHFVSEPSPPTRVCDGGLHDEASRGQRDPEEVEEPARLGRQSEPGRLPDRLCIIRHSPFCILNAKCRISPNLAPGCGCDSECQLMLKLVLVK